MRAKTRGVSGPLSVIGRWRRLSLRVKMTLTLLLTSVVAIATVGSVAHWMLFREFTHSLHEGAYERYRKDVASFIETYGSWEEGQKNEEFGEFAMRNNQPPPAGFDRRLSARGGPMSGAGFQGGHSPNGMLQPGDPGYGPPAGFGDRRQDNPGFGGPPQRGWSPEGGGPHRQTGGGPGYGMQPPVGGPGGPPGDGPRGEGPRGGDQTAVPPYRFLLINAQGKALAGDDTYSIGQAVPEEVRREADPIMVKGKVVAYTIPLSNPNLTSTDRAYIATLDEALRYGTVVAVVLTLVVGVVLGNRLSAGLRELTLAARAMGSGQLRQNVPVRSMDEVGILAATFNRMSCDLAQAHEDLAASAEQIRRQAEQLKELSVRDGLTQLHNRRYFDEQATRMFAEARRYKTPLTFMIGDVDHFKKVNDTFSHSVGDEVLRIVARLLRENTRTSDLVARYGGEEFVIAFPQTQAPHAALCCENLRRKIQDYPWHTIHPSLRVTMSMGLSDQLEVESYERVLAEADSRLYQAKHGGRNQVVAGPERSLSEG